MRVAFDVRSLFLLLTLRQLSQFSLLSAVLLLSACATKPGDIIKASTSETRPQAVYLEWVALEASIAGILSSGSLPAEKVFQLGSAMQDARPAADALRTALNNVYRMKEALRAVPDDEGLAGRLSALQASLPGLASSVDSLVKSIQKEKDRA